MEQSKSQTLKTARLTLRRFVAEDAAPAFRNWTCDPEVTKYMTWFAHKSRQETEDVISLWLAEYETNPNYFQWAIVPDTLGEPIGSIGAVRTDDRTLTCEMGYCIGKRFWHQGYVAEALSAVLGYLFHLGQFRTITARHDVRNPASGAVMRKCGMHFVARRENIGLTKEGEPLCCDYYEINQQEL